MRVYRGEEVVYELPAYKIVDMQRINYCKSTFYTGNEYQTVKTLEDGIIIDGEKLLCILTSADTYALEDGIVNLVMEYGGSFEKEGITITYEDIFKTTTTLYIKGDKPIGPKDNYYTKEQADEIFATKEYVENNKYIYFIYRDGGETEADKQHNKEAYNQVNEQLVSGMTPSPVFVMYPAGDSACGFFPMNTIVKESARNISFRGPLSHDETNKLLEWGFRVQSNGDVVSQFIGYKYQKPLTPGNNISIDNDVISCTLSVDAYTKDEVDEKFATKEEVSGITGDKESLATASKTNLVSAINEVNTIAKGANRAISFYNYSHLVTMLQNGQYPDLRIGQNIYINKMDVPDLWVVATGLPNVSYTYSTDEAFIEYVKTTGRVGPYSLGFLETEKVYLDNYYTKDEVDAKIPSLSGYATEEWVNEQGFLTEHQQLKTINGETIVGEGDIEIQGGDSYDGNIYLSGSSDNVEWMRAQNKKVWDMLEAGTYKGGSLIQISNDTYKSSPFTSWFKAMGKYTFTAEYYEGSTQQMYYNSVSLWETSASLSAYNAHTLQRKLSAGDGITINGTTISAPGNTYSALTNGAIFSIDEAKFVGVNVNFKYVADGYVFSTRSNKYFSIRVSGGTLYNGETALGGSLTKNNTYNLYLVYDYDNEGAGYYLYINDTPITSFGYDNPILGEGKLYIGAGCMFDYEDSDIYSKNISKNVINYITTINGFNWDDGQLSYFDTYTEIYGGLYYMVVDRSYTVHKFIGKTEGSHHFIYDRMTGWERMLD